MRFANATSSTGNQGEGSVYDMPPAGLRQGSAGAKFAHSEVIAILTLVACAQLLTWPGLRLKLQTQNDLSGSSVLGLSEAR
jgi:hypothetical protein